MFSRFLRSGGVVTESANQLRHAVLHVACEGTRQLQIVAPAPAPREQVGAVAVHCNTLKGEMEDFQNRLGVAERFGNEPFLPPNERRLLLKEEVLKKVTRRGKVETRVFLLFSDVLAYGTGDVGNVAELRTVIELQYDSKQTPHLLSLT